MDGLTEGRMVHFVLPNGEHRAATVVRVFPPAPLPTEGPVRANLQVHVDGTNDAAYLWDKGAEGLTVWETSVPYSEGREPRTWHWIERA